MVTVYKMSSFCIRYSMFPVLHIILLIFVTFQPNVYAAVSETEESETKYFQCQINIFADFEGYLSCTFSLSYQSDEIIPECKSREQLGMGVQILRGKKYTPRKNLFKDALKCKSDFPFSVQVGFQENEILSSFTEMNQERIIGQYYNTSSYEYQLTVNFPKAEITLQVAKTTLVTYKIIAKSPTSFLEAGVLIHFSSGLPIGTCDQDGQPLFPLSNSTFEISGQPFLEIAIVSFETKSFSIHRTICKGKFTGICMSFDDVPCFEIPKTSLRIEGYNIITENDTFANYIPVSKFLEAANIIDKRLEVLTRETFPDEYLAKLLPLIRSPGERLIVVNNENIQWVILKMLLDALENKLNNSCVPQKTFIYNELQYILQKLYLKERLIMENTSMFFNPLQGIMIKNEFLRIYGNGDYRIRVGDCPRPIEIYFKDFETYPKWKSLFPQFPTYDILNGMVKSGVLDFNCSSSTEKLKIEKTIGNDYVNVSFHNYQLADSHLKYRSTAAVQLYPNFKPFALQCVGSTTFWTVYAPENSSTSIVIPFGSGLGLRNVVNRLSPFYYSSKDNFFACSGFLTAKIRKWKCENRLQCQITKSKCLGDNKDLDSNEISIPRDQNCMQSLLDVQAQPCLEVGEIGKSFEDDLQCWATQPDEKGIVQCYGSGVVEFGTFEFHYTYFRGFDDHIYIENEMKTAPPIDAVLKITSLNSSDEVYFVKGEYIFRCEAHSYFYEEGIQWFLKFENETVLHSQSSANIRQHVMDNEQVSTNVVSEIKLYITDTSLLEVICSAPIYATILWHNISTKLMILESIPPNIISLESSIQLSEGVKDQGITCQANGRPQPKYTWRIPEELDNALQILKENTLYFPEYNSTFSGEYSCTATNIAGNDTMPFYVSGKREKRSTILYTIIGICMAPIVFSSVLYFIYSRSEKIKKYRQMKEIIGILNGDSQGTQEPDERDDDEGIYKNQIHCPFNEDYEIAKNSFLIDRKKILGRGAFGEVYKGLLNGMDKTVAFKTVRPNCTFMHLKALASEAKILMYIGVHENIVKLLGVYRQEIKSGILHVAIEYCELGSIEKFLHTNRHQYVESNTFRTNFGYEPNGIQFSLDTLIKWSEQIANGMEYLGTKKVIHSDLATRNVLLTIEQKAKVTDFGLSRHTYNYSEYVKTGKDPVAWRWVAIESLKTNKYSSQSDVWAYGILLWEMFSLGDVPYPGMEYSLDFIQKVEDGMRNKKPQAATEEIYEVMSLCWNIDPSKRPTFSDLKLMFGSQNASNRRTCINDLTTPPGYVGISCTNSTCYLETD